MKKYLRYAMVCLFVLGFLSMLAPFVAREVPEIGAVSYTGFDMMNGDNSIPGMEKDNFKLLATEDGGAMLTHQHYYAMMLVSFVVGAAMCLLDRRGFSCYVASLIAGLVAALSAAMLIVSIPATYLLPEGIYEPGWAGVMDKCGWGVYSALIVAVLAIAASCYGLSARDRAKSEPMSIHLIARIGVLSAVAAVLYYIPGIPVIPPIYKLDFSTVPVLIGGFSMGIWPGLAILFIKDLTGLMHSSSMGVGEIADFITSAALMIPAVLMYTRGRRSFKMVILGMLAGLAAMLAAAALSNYYIMIPFYESAMGMPVDQIVATIAKTIPAVDSLWKMILLAVIPFNLLKGAIICLITVILYKRLSPMLKGGANLS